jgi:hypothetical protein
VALSPFDDQARHHHHRRGIMGASGCNAALEILKDIDLATDLRG